MYYIMDCPLILHEDNSAAVVELHNNFKLAGIRRWKSGARIDPEREKNIPNPIEINFETFYGYQGPPPEMEDLGITIMSKRLRDVLGKAGIDNIQYYPAVLKNITNNQRYDYYVYNIIGSVSAMNLKESDYELYRGESTTPSTSIHKLVLDETKVNRLLLFRLAENVSTVIVHERVKQQIESANINTIKFIKPEEYSQI